MRSQTQQPLHFNTYPTMNKTVFFLMIFLVIKHIAFGQEVIAPAKFLKYPTSLNFDEVTINAYELPNNSGYLFPMTLYVPYNLTLPGNYFSSAKLVKADNNGTVLASFIADMDTPSNLVFRGLQSVLASDEVIFFVTMDSALNSNNSINKGIIVFHLDSSNLSFQSADTFLNILPANASITNWFQLQSSPDVTFNTIVYSPLSQPLVYKNLLFKLITHNTASIISTLSIDSLLASINESGFNPTFNTHWDVNKDSVTLFMSNSDSALNQQVLRVINIDTLLSAFSSITVPYGQLAYASGKYVETSLSCQGLLTDNKVFIGPQLDDEVFKTIGLLRYNVNTSTYDKALTIPDSVNFSYYWKTYPPFEAVVKSDNNIFCLGFDFNVPSKLYFDTVENHLYVGKTDTSLNQWHWYKYIGNPHCYHVPYKLLATSDGGCLITASIYDYVNNANLEHDVYVIKLDNNGFITHVSNLTNNVKDHVSVYPVPAQEELFLSYNGNEPYSLILWDMAGKVVLKHTDVTQATHKISLSGLTSGNYVYQVRFKSGKTESGKIIKQ